MAIRGGGFEGYVDPIGRGSQMVTGRASDITSRLDVGMGSAGKMLQDMSRARRESRDMQKELDSLKRSKEQAFDPQQIEYYERQIISATRRLEEHRKATDKVKVGLQGLEKGVGSLVKGLVSMNAGILGIGFDFLITSIKRVYELQERWTKAIGVFNMRIGGMTKGLSGATKAATQWSGTIRGLTGGDIQEGIELFGEFTEAMSRTVKAGDGFSKFGLQMARGFNLGGKASGDLTRVLEQLGDTSDEATRLIGKDLIRAANEAGVPVNMIAKDIAGSTKYMARFGKEGLKTFVQGAAFARKFAISVDQLRSSVEDLDIFDNATELTSKMNTAFGTMLSSLDLMMEDDPAKRLDMIRQQLLAQGKTFDKLMPTEARYLSQMTKLNEDQLASLLSLKNANVSYEQFKKAQEKTEKHELDAKRAMEQQLRSTAQTMYAFGIAFDRITVAIGKAIRPLLEVFGLAKSSDKDFKSFGERMESITVTFEKFFESLARNEKWNVFMRELAVDLMKAGAAIRDFVMDGRAADLVGDIAEGMRKFYGFIKDVGRTVVPALRPLLDIFLKLSQHLDKIVALWGVLKVGNMASSLVPGGGGSAMSGLAAAFGGVSPRMTQGKVPGTDFAMASTRSRFAPSTQNAGARGMAGVGLGLAAGGMMGGSAAMAGGAIGGLVGAFVPIIGPFLGIVGAAIGKGLDKLFSSDVKSKLELAMEKLAESQSKLKDSSEVLEKYQSLQAAKRSTQDAKDMQADKAILKLKERRIPLDSDERQLVADRIVQLHAFNGVTKDNVSSLVGMAEKGYASRDMFEAIKASQMNYKQTVMDLDAESEKLLNDQKLQNDLRNLELARKQAELDKKIAEQDIARLEANKKAVADVVGAISGAGAGANFLSKLAGIGGGQAATTAADELEKIKNVNDATFKLQQTIERKRADQATIETNLNNLQISLQQKQLDAFREAGVLNSELVRGAAQEARQSGRSFDLKTYVKEHAQELAGATGSSVGDLKRLYGFASGGIVTRPTYGLIGEAGPEAVIPLRAMARGRVNAPSQHGGSMARSLAYGSSGGNVRIVSTMADIHMDGRKVGTAMIQSAMQAGGE